jgi:hypothetical protein
MRVLSYFVVLCVLCLSAGCKVSPPDSAVIAGVLKLEISMSSTNQVDTDSFPNSDEISVKLRLVDANNNPQSAQIIAVSTSLGTLTTEQVLTNADGYATTTISPSDSLGAGTLTASFDKITTKQNFELLGALPPTPISKPKISLSLSSPSQVDSDSFPNSDSVTITALLVDANNLPLKGEIIKLSTSLSSVLSEDILTDAQGKATTKINPSDVMGAGAITATFGTVIAKYNFELLAPLPPAVVAAPKISLSLLRAGLAINRFKSDEVVQLQALVTDENNAPLANRVVKFTAELGSTNVPTGLTNLSGIAQVNLSADNTKLGAAEASASVAISSANFSSRLNYEIIDSAITITEQVTKLGYFNSSNVFVENKLGSSIAPDVNGEINISAGGTLGISLALVDENNLRIMTPTQVNFSSVCVGSQKARIGASVFTVNGVANTTYEDISCGGAQDSIQATVTINNQTKSISQTIRIAPENIGSIEFISSSPQSIVLKGTGGQGLQETSTLTFLVKGTLGNPLAQQAVTFSLNTSAGNLTIIPASSITNSFGLVTTKVNAGNVPTAVRVTASVTTASNQVIQTQSDLLSVNTGMPDQDSFSLASELLNPEADGYDGTQVEITARLADAFNNPVPDGTSINFTTEGGSIVPSCNTLNGTCSVKWTSAEPRFSNHRMTVLATAVGHETFFDTNGSNTFDPADGVAFTSNAQSGIGRISPAASGFWDMTEAWRDDNENFTFDSGEKFIDFDNDQIFGVSDGKFNGPQCQGTLCGVGNKASLHVRKALVMVMSGSSANLLLASATQQDFLNPTYVHINGARVYRSNIGGVIENSSLTLAEETFEQFTLYFSDDGLPFGQILPAGTSVTVVASAGTLAGNTTFTLPNSIGGNDPNVYNGNAMSFSLSNPNTVANAGDTTLNGILKITVTTPKGNESIITLGYVLTGI